MKHLKNFIQLFEKRELKERWDTDLTKESFLQLYKEKCKNHKRVSKKTLFIRRDEHVAGKLFAFVTPKTNEHAWAQNYEAVLLDNLQCFSHLPKRSKSIMAATDIERFQNNNDLDKTRQRPDAFVMIPVDNAMIGECEGDDFWFSFDIEPINMLFDNIDITFNVKDPFTTFEDMKTELSKFDGQDLLELEKGKHLEPAGVLSKLFQKHINSTEFSFEKFITVLNKELSKDTRRMKNKPYVATYKALMGNSEEHEPGIEVWTEGPVFLVQLAEYENIFGPVDEILASEEGGGDW